MSFRFPRGGFPRRNPHNGRGRLPPYSARATHPVHWSPVGVSNTSWPETAQAQGFYAANTYFYEQLGMPSYTSSVVAPGESILDDLSIVRIVGSIVARIIPGSVAQTNVLYQGIYVGETALGGSSTQDNAEWLVDRPDGQQRWLWLRQIVAVGCPSGTNSNFGAFSPSLNSDLIGPDYSKVDLKYRGMRLRPNQRLILTSYLLCTGGAGGVNDAEFNNVQTLRVLFRSRS